MVWLWSQSVTPLNFQCAPGGRDAYPCSPRGQDALLPSAPFCGNALHNTTNHIWFSSDFAHKKEMITAQLTVMSMSYVMTGLWEGRQVASFAITVAIRCSKGSYYLCERSGVSSVRYSDLLCAQKSLLIMSFKRFCSVFSSHLCSIDSGIMSAVGKGKAGWKHSKHSNSCRVSFKK